MNNDLEHILKNIISNSDKQMGHKVPDDYFDNLEDTVFIKISESRFSKEIGFKIPKGYFDKVEDEIFTKIQPTKKGKVISISNRLWKIIPAAIAASLLLFFGFYFLENKQTTDNNLLASDIEEWFDDSLEYSTDYELALILENDLEFNDNEIVFQDDMIENYFDNISDIDLLNEIE